jgi:hypothetical protein
MVSAILASLDFVKAVFLRRFTFSSIEVALYSFGPLRIGIVVGKGLLYLFAYL